jgi:hypothetical protein
MTTKLKWYTAKTGNHQGLVIEEDTGRNVAVAYDGQDAPLLAAAPELLEALKNLVTFPLGTFQVEAALAAIAKATGKE